MVSSERRRCSVFKGFWCLHLCGREPRSGFTDPLLMGCRCNARFSLQVEAPFCLDEIADGMLTIC